jgi:release factor glutamine methyltransferase
MTVSEWLLSATKRLAAVGIDSPGLDAKMLAAHLFGKDRTWVITHPEAEIDEPTAQALLRRREAREPLAYILEWREFYGRRFTVKPGVLIPRQETEVLLESALGTIRNGPVLDVGTGSGCLAITIKLEKQDVDVVGLDVSSKALEIARSNSELLGAEVEWVHSDLFQGVQGRKFEVIVSNPPYIADSEQLMPEVVEHEPRGALFSGPTGLEFYERLAREAIPHLADLGRLIVEVGHTQSQQIERLFQAEGWFHEWTKKDLSGVDRVLAFSRPNL